MKFELDSARSAYTIRGYQADCILIGDQRFSGPLVITPDGIHIDLLPQNFAELLAKHLQAVAALGAEIIIVGSGAKQIFLPPALSQALAANGVGVEVMNTPAACRCYNVLASEARAVAGVLYPAHGGA